MKKLISLLLIVTVLLSNFIISGSLYCPSQDNECGTLLCSDSMVSCGDYAELNCWGDNFVDIKTALNSVNQGEVRSDFITIGVIDTGINYADPYFNGRVINSKINTSNSGLATDAIDDNGHGTQIASIITRCTPDTVTIRAYKALDRYGNGTFSSVSRAIVSAVKDGVDVINMSFGFFEYSKVLDDAVNYALINGVIIVAAAGNSASSEPFYPSSFDGVIRVGAINENSSVASFCNKGNIDFYAPGNSIDVLFTDGNFRKTKGTSVAAAYVSAVISLIKSVSPTMSFDNIYELLCTYSFIPDILNNSPDGNGCIKCPPLSVISDNLAKTPTPDFSKPSGIYYTDFYLEIKKDNPDDIIYYSFNKSIPSNNSENSFIYTSPIHITSSCVVNAVAYRNGCYHSNIAQFRAGIAEKANGTNLNIDSRGYILSYTGNAKTLFVPNTIGNTIINGVASGAFSESKLTTVYLPDSVKEIENSAFKDCENLEIISATGVKKIYDNAFYNCKRLHNTYFSTLSYIGKYAFYSAGISFFESYDFTFELSFANKVTIPASAFENSALHYLKAVYIEKIESNAFKNCKGLCAVEINKLTTMECDAFNGCENIVRAVIGSLKNISENSFSGCRSLESIVFNNVVSVDNCAFSGCTVLSDISLPLLESLSVSAFYQCISLISLDLPSLNNIFYDDSKPSITSPFPKNLIDFSSQSLESTIAFMFSSSPKIEKISLPAVTLIADNTFSGCKSIKHLDIKSVKSLNDYSLNNCQAELINAPSLQTAKKIPENSGILLSHEFENVDDIPENMTIYGMYRSNAHSFAQTNNINFVALPIVTATTKTDLPFIDTQISVDVLGFDVQYQWFANQLPTVKNAVQIDGATKNTYTYSANDDFQYYFCRVLINDGSVISADYSDFISKSGKIIESNTSFIFAPYIKKPTLTLLDSSTIKTYFCSNTLYANFSIVNQSLNIIKVSKDFKVTCKDEGTATVTVTADISDGTVISVPITIDCQPTLFQKFILKLLHFLKWKTQ